MVHPVVEVAELISHPIKVGRGDPFFDVGQLFRQTTDRISVPLELIPEVDGPNQQTNKDTAVRNQQRYRELLLQEAFYFFVFLRRIGARRAFLAAFFPAFVYG